ncbi:MAG: AAA family ATPase [Deltaproteobacteria bacterium]|nr:AAA family ATPase [Deltaproteobacteria bacterium]
MENSINTKPRRIAICGKGGVGKTSLSTMMVKIFAEMQNLKILAVDADPAVGLAMALGMKVEKTVDDIRNKLISQVKAGNSYDKSEVLDLLDYELFDALAESSNVALLAIGRPETEGCYCRVNDLLKDIIESLSHGFDIVLIDGEAGVEQINRRVLSSVDDLILISDTSLKGIQVVSTIQHVARDNNAVTAGSIGLVLNRVRSEDEVQTILNSISMNLLGWIPEDEIIHTYDFQGIPLTKMPEDTPSLAVVRSIVAAMNV